MWLEYTHCSFAIIFMPSSTGPVTLPFKYCLVGAPCGGASLGIVVTGSGCCDVARLVTSLPFVLRLGVPMRGGAGLVMPIAGLYCALSLALVLHLGTRCKSYIWSIWRAITHDGVLHVVQQRRLRDCWWCDGGLDGSVESLCRCILGSRGFDWCSFLVLRR